MGFFGSDGKAYNKIGNVISGPDGKMMTRLSDGYSGGPDISMSSFGNMSFINSGHETVTISKYGNLYQVSNGKTYTVAGSLLTCSDGRTWTAFGSKWTDLDIRSIISMDI